MNENQSYGAPPIHVDEFDIEIPEFMHYQYLPVWLPETIEKQMVFPPNLEVIRPLAEAAVVNYRNTIWHGGPIYVYITARHGFATPDNPLNRPGWHCDGFGTDDVNYIWWRGTGTWFAIQDFDDIKDDHIESLKQFSVQVKNNTIETREQCGLYRLDPYVVHAAPGIDPPGEMRSFVKISISKHKYNLQGNSHNYLIDYDWEMHPRDAIRNDPHKAGHDFV